jgi:hypothetical protein
MATGKELARLVSCGAWREWVEEKSYYLSHQLYDSDGHQITVEQVTTQVFCHLRLLVSKTRDGSHMDEEYVKLLGAMLRLVASTNSESMALSIHQDYGFWEIIIS